MEGAATLGAKLGTTVHLSPLLRKARKFGLDARGLEQLAIQRGCDYYQGDGPVLSRAPSVEEFSDTELALALLSPALRYHPQTLRLGAAMLGADGNVPHEIGYLAKLERCEAVVRYVAECGRRFEPANEFWTDLLKCLPAGGVPPKSAVVPHPTRFVAMTGMTRRGVENVTEWIRPIRPSS